MESGCNDNSPECICPCGCGCQNDPNGGDLPFYHCIGGEPIETGEIGYCHSCAHHSHEPPPGNNPDNAIAALESVLAQWKS